MAKEQLAPLILCMESATGEDVAIQIEPNDDFQSFLDKAKLILGFDVDINSITKNQPVKLNENIYDFFINAEQEMQNDIEEKTSVIPEAASEEREDYIYILDDGTQIKASQADDNAATSSNPVVDTRGRANQHSGLIDSLQLKENLRETTVTSSDESSAKSSPSTKSLSYIPNIPFKLVRDENPEFDTELSKYVNDSEKGTKNGSQTALKPLEYIINSEEALTRDEVLEMFKDSPIVEAISGVRTSPSADTSSDKPRRVRKTNPANRFPQLTKDLQKSSVEEAHRCSLCQKVMANETEVNRVTNIKMNPSATIKAIVVCDDCLNLNFSLFKEILGDVELSSDDYLVEKLDIKMVYKKRRNVTSLRAHTDAANEQSDSNNTIEDAKAIIEKIETELRKQSSGTMSDDSLGFIKLELDINGELLAKSIDDKGNYLLQFTKDNIKEEPFWTERTESDFGDIECLESTEDQVMNFMETHGLKDYVCRLCSETLVQLEEAIVHSLQHHLVAEDVYPCILCEYGYKTASELKHHMLKEHRRPAASRQAQLVLDSETSSPVSGPVSGRTRSASFKTEYKWPLRGVQKKSLKTDGELDPVTGEKVDTLEPRIKTEIKEEVAEVSEEDEEGIWIVQTTSEPDAEGEDTLVQLLRNALDVKENFDNSELMGVLEGHTEDQKAQKTEHRCTSCK